jgi:hypothetical protein
MSEDDGESDDVDTGKKLFAAKKKKANFGYGSEDDYGDEDDEDDSESESDHERNVFN